MKKTKKPGENISLKTKKNEAPVIIDWINSQTNLMDSIRYLIENEVRVNGIRNLQNYIPSERAIATNVVQTIANDEVAISNAQNLEMAATKEKTVVETNAHSYPLTEDQEIPHADDDIDEDDIDSWI
jgi:hypothetical protein